MTPDNERGTPVVRLRVGEITYLLRTLDEASDPGTHGSRHRAAYQKLLGALTQEQRVEMNLTDPEAIK